MNLDALILFVAVAVWIFGGGVALYFACRLAIRTLFKVFG